MAEDNTAPVEGGNGTSTDDKTAALTAARELLIAEGHQVLDSSAFHGIKTEAAAKAEAKYAEAQAKLEATQAENADLAKYKSSIENKDKSDNELHNERQRAWQTSDKEKDAAKIALEKQLTESKDALARERVQNKIRSLMPDSVNPELSLMWAERYVGKFLSTDESGQLVWTDPTGVPHLGPAAEKNFTDWWKLDAQKSQRSGNVPGPATSGAPSAPTPQNQTAYARNPALSQIDNYAAAEEWAKQQGPK